MDIAKIRKKLRESEANSRHAKAEGRTTKRPQNHDAQPDEKVCEPSANHGPTSGAEYQTPNRAQMTEGETDRDIGQEPEPTSPKESKEKKERAKTRVTGTKIDSEKTEEVVEILTFRLMKEDFALRISHLEEILRYQRITKVPKVPKWVLGLTSLRGKVIPVVDLKLKLSLTGESSNIDQKGKLLIIKGPKGPIGAAVDKVIGVVRITKSEILPPPSHLSETELRFIDGVAIVDKRFVSIINMEETVSLHSQ